MIVTLHVQHLLLKQRFFECRFDDTARIAAIKSKVYQMTGTLPQDMTVQLRKSESVTVPITNDESCLRDYGAQNGMDLLIDDTNPFSIARDAGLTDLTKIDKYVMPDSEYGKRDGTVRDYLRKKFENDPEYRESVLAYRRKRNEENLIELKKADEMSVGMRCKISGERKGTIAYIGPVPSLASGPFIGIELDEPFGNTDGKHGDASYFTCTKNYGIFVKPSTVLVGDFPEEEINLDTTSESEL